MNQKAEWNHLRNGFVRSGARGHLELVLSTLHKPKLDGETASYNHALTFTFTSADGKLKITSRVTVVLR